MCRWVSTRPGITIMRAASITSALGALMFGRTAAMVLPSIKMSAASKSPSARSRVRTQPPLIRIARPGAAPPAGCCALAVPMADAVTAAAATAPAVPVQRNSRRDSADDGAQAPHTHVLPEPALRRSVMISSRVFLLM